jgi:hypothetical protein
MMDRLTRFVTHHRLLVIGPSIALTMLGLFATPRSSGRCSCRPS